MKRLDIFGGIFLSATLISITYLSPTLHNQIKTLEIAYDYEKFTITLEEEKKQRIAMLTEEINALGMKDKNLKKCILEKATPIAADPLNNKRNYHVSDINNIICADMNIFTLSGIDGITNISTIILFSNKIRDLRPLSKLHKLEFLDISYNAIDSISAISELPKLKSLNLEGNKIHDITSLSKSITLEHLVFPDLSNMYCSDIEYIQSFEHIKRSTNTREHYCKGNSNKNLTTILSKDRSQWTREDEINYLQHRINERKKKLNADTQ